MVLRRAAPGEWVTELQLVTNHRLPLYAAACWSSDGGGRGDADVESCRRDPGEHHLVILV